jgi:hypothetical protein
MPVTPGARSAFGIGKETVAGTAVAATRWAPWATLTPKDNQSPLVDEGLRGSMATEYGMVLGPAFSELDFAGPGMVDNLGDLLQNILGDYTVGAAVSGVFPHTIGLLNSGQGQPVTHTVVDAQQLTATVGARSYAGACLSELKLSGNAEGLFMAEGKCSAYPSAPAALAPTNVPTSETVIPAWRSTVSIAGAPTLNVAEWEVTLQRELQVQHATDGTQAPYGIFRGPLTVAAQLTLIALDESPLITGLLTNQQPAVVITVNNGGATTALRELVVTMTKAAYTDATPTRQRLLGWQVPIKCIANATDAAASGGLSPIKAVLKNAVATYA